VSDEAGRLWPNSRQLIEPNQSHNISEWGCQESMVDAFIEQGAAGNLDTGCLQTTPLPTIPTASN
jgi:hypothetical protein